MNRLAIQTKETQRSHKGHISTALEKMPLPELQIIVRDLRADLEKAVRFVNEQEGELTSQRQLVIEIENKINRASETERLRLYVELANEREKKEMLEATIIGQRRNLRKREDIYNQHWQVLRRRQGAFDPKNGYARKPNLKPLAGQNEDHLNADDLEELEVSAPKKGNLSTYLRIFKRKAWLIGGLTGIATFIALLWSSAESQVYVGNFYLLVEPITSAGKLSDPTTLTRTGGVPNEELLALDYPTNLAFLQSPGMTSRIAQDVYKKELNRKPDAIWKDIRENLVVKRVGQGREATKIFEVTYQGTNPQEVIAILETASETFLKYSSEDRQTNIKAGIEFIDKQLPDQRKRLETLKAQQQSIRQQYALVDPLAKSQELMTQINKLDDQLITNQSQLDSRKKLYTVLQGQLKLTPQEALASAALSQDPTRLSLLTQLQQVESEIAVASARFTSKSPLLQELEDKRQNIVNALDRKTQQILTQNSLSVQTNSSILTYQDPTRLKLIDQLVGTANEIQVLEVNTGSLATVKQSLEREAKQLPKVANQYSAIDRQIALTNEILDKMLMQRETLKVEAAQDLPWQLISPPQIPLDEEGQPIGEAPGRKKKVAAGAAAGLLLGMVLAIWLEKRRDTFYTNDDIAGALSLPVIGDIPYDEHLAPAPNLVLALENLHQSQEKENDEDKEDKNLEDSSFLAAFESLYAQLSFLNNNSSIGSLVISSVEPEDGQSTVALHLAKTVARTGKRVLLIDANFRNPQLHDWLDLTNDAGLFQLLKGAMPPDEVVQNTLDIDNLLVLTAGISQPDPSSRIWSASMLNLIEELHSKYDLVIYDAPKFLDSTDASFLAAHTDGILMVVGVAKTSQSLLKKAIDRMKAYHLNCLGAVANHLNAK